MKEPTKQQQIAAIREILHGKKLYTLNSQIEKLIEHVDVHRYFLGETIPFPVSWHDALFSWYELIFVDIERYINSQLFSFNFPDLREKEVGLFEAGRHKVEMYFILSEQMYLSSEHAMEKKKCEPSVREVAELYVLLYGLKPVWLKKLSIFLFG